MTTTERTTTERTQAPVARPTKPSMLSHVAYITHDTAATVAFYTDVMGMELVNAVLDDKIPSTGDCVPR